MIELTPQNSTLLIYTEREGALSPVGHDLCLAASKFEVTIDGDTVSGWADPSSLTVRGAVDGGEVKPISAKDGEKILKKMHKDVFSAKGRVEVDGTRDLITLKYAGKTAQIPVSGLSATVSMAKLGMAQVTAFFGALRVCDEVRVSLETDVEL